LGRRKKKKTILDPGTLKKIKIPVIFQWNFCFDFLINQLINLFLAADVVPAGLGMEY
jgi:hypothetical protein